MAKPMTDRIVAELPEVIFDRNGNPMNGYRVAGALHLYVHRSTGEDPTRWDASLVSPEKMVRETLATGWKNQAGAARRAMEKFT